MMRVDYVPNCAEWVYSASDPIATLAVYETFFLETNKIC